ncbi:hypothetical protein LV478_11580 [Komagataeibacter oboediens]|uniref:hypothetical protein n=1 Tax=Komagataeibacter oboediens TaxID=65958 RepID=UPI0023DC97A6|nr:hypothetical protein [Komagataeibacter oboediens]WEQ51170.1 hypothetical protein LV478_11580 [Komagataeibacter oboediens]
MTAPWNGLPDQPERSGWHNFWLEGLKPDPEIYSDAEAEPVITGCYWDADTQCWSGFDEVPVPAEDAAKMVDFEYIGPVYNRGVVAQMQKDTERLNWLEKQRFPELRAFDDGFLVATDQVCRSSGISTAREAIDAAMNAENGQ